MTPFYLTTMKELPDEGKGNLDVSQKSVPKFRSKNFQIVLGVVLGFLGIP